MDSLRECLGSGLQNGTAALLHLGRAFGQPAEERSHLLADLILAAQAGVGRDFIAYPILDRFVRVEVGAVGRQTYQTQLQVGCGQVGPQRYAPIAPQPARPPPPPPPGLAP